MQISSNNIYIQPIFGTILFALAYYHQHIAHVTLANLRKGNELLIHSFIQTCETCDSIKFALFLDPKNKQKHSLPKGGLFNYVSCPNFLCEIIIYAALYIILGFRHYPWALITLFVLTNQVFSYIIWWLPLARRCNLKLYIFPFQTCRSWLLQWPKTGINLNSRNFLKQEELLSLSFTDTNFESEYCKYKVDLRNNSLPLSLHYDLIDCCMIVMKVLNLNATLFGTVVMLGFWNTPEFEVQIKKDYPRRRLRCHCICLDACLTSSSSVSEYETQVSGF